MAAVVDKDTCLGCGACEGVCPNEAVKVGDDGYAVVDEENCVECGACTAECPVEAITL